MPVYVHVIDHPDARVLVDTGMTELHPAMADLDPRLRPLSEQDFDLAGIDIVVNTHLHFDHCGGNHLFAGKPIYVQRRELDDARSEDGYTIREWVEAPGVRYVPVDGELELSFTYNDPLIDVTLRTNANDVAEGEVIELPAEPSLLLLSVLYDEVEYRSDLGPSAMIDQGASGTVEMQVLLVDDESGAADISALLDATLVSTAGDELRVEGFLEDSVASDVP